MTLRDLRQQIGRLLISGFDGFSVPVEMRALAREFDLGGLILFSRNVEAPEQVAEIAVAARELAQRAAVVGERGPGGRPGSSV